MSLRDGTDRYRVVRTGFWWRVRIGDGQQTVGRCYTETEAQRLAAALLTAYRDGVFVAEQSAKARREARENCGLRRGGHEVDKSTRPGTGIHSTRWRRAR